MLLARPLGEASQYMSIRGKNLVFLNSILGALQIDKLDSTTRFSDIKKAVSPDVVRKVHLLLDDVWPNFSDYERAIRRDSNNVTALYTGNYEPECLFQSITRLSLYCDKIFLVDPFMNPRGVNSEYSPLEHPDQHRANTIKNLYLWLTLYPWIEAGIVSFIRPLYDFIPNLHHEVLKLQKEKFDSNPELENFLRADIEGDMKAMGAFDKGMGELVLLSQPDEMLTDFYESMNPSNPFPSKEDFFSFIERKRNDHPYYVELLPGQNCQFHMETSGCCYELAKRLCSLSNSHIVTDMNTRWKEVEFDRESAGIDLQSWSPFAKALQNSEFKSLNNVPLTTALNLRKENRLVSMRHFFRRVWKDCRNPDEFSDENAIDLASQLTHETAMANEEWKKIDRDLLKWLGCTGAALVSTGLIGFVPAASAGVFTGITGLIDAQMKRGSFKERFPAGLFISNRQNK